MGRNKNGDHFSSAVTDVTCWLNLRERRLKAAPTA